MAEYNFKTLPINRYDKKTGKTTTKNYVTVNERVKYFRVAPEYKDWSLETTIEKLDLEHPSNPDQCMMCAVIKDPKGRVISTGRAWEVRDASFINKTSFIENCETSAVGRALAFLGIGIDDSIATFEEVIRAQQAQKTVDTSGLRANGKTPETPTPIALAAMADALKPNPNPTGAKVDASNIVIPFGKFKGKNVMAVPYTELNSWWSWLNTTDFDKTKNLPLTKAVETVLGAA